jgi:hypothetical protein
VAASLWTGPLYNAATDFAPVALIAETPFVLVAPVIENDGNF